MCALALTTSRDLSTPRAARLSISSNRTARSMTTPLPMTGVHGRGEDSARQQVQGVLLGRPSRSMTTVWPALLPPLNLTT